MIDTVAVRKVETKADYKAFFEFPWTIYKDDPNWVPPLLSMRHEILDKDKNPSWSYLDGDYYVAWRGDQPVGTIAAFANKHHNEFHNEHISWFGFFEVLDDQAAAIALLQTAVEWGRSRGYDAVRGPQSFTAMDECGLLIDNFSRPIMLMPYNPPYYQRLIEDSGLGYEKVMDTHSLYHSWEKLHSSNVRERMDKLLKRVHRNQNIYVRGINPKNLKSDFILFKDIYNAAWERNWGFTPFTSAELDVLVKDLGMFFDPQLACFAYLDDEPVGFLLSVPDFGQVLQRANPRPGVPEIFSLIKAGWYWKVKRVIDWVRVPLMGVKEEHRNKGVDLAMYDFILNQMAESKYKHLDSGWVLETNAPMLRVGQSLGMEIYKTYRFYEKTLK